MSAEDSGVQSSEERETDKIRMLKLEPGIVAGNMDTQVNEKCGSPKKNDAGPITGKRDLEGGTSTEQEFSVYEVANTWIPEDYEEFVDSSLLDLEFEPDVFQKQSFYLLSRKQNILVTAHTSSGKTLVAEYAMALAKKNNGRVIYTSPIKALSNQKYYEFKGKYNTGIITGDVQISTDADLLIVTTEILKNMLYKQSNLTNNLLFVIFDEVHYIGNEDRGVVWEECLILLPKTCNVVLLSATITGVKSFATWISTVRKSATYVISTLKRAVPLKFFSFENYGLAEITRNYKIVKDANKGKTIGGLIELLRNRHELPCIIFCFSRKRCGEIANMLGNFTDSAQRKGILDFFDRSLNQVVTRETDRTLPQVTFIRNLINLGIGIHHGGMLPILREIVELLFAHGYLKVLIATETFSMGINMPAKSVVFLSLFKKDRKSKRLITTSEFLQMSGRAGRRNVDIKGNVVIYEGVTNMVVNKLIFGDPEPLKSKFKLSFNMILLTYRVNLKIEDIMRFSLYESKTYSAYFNDMRKRAQLSDDLNELVFTCCVCTDIDNYFDILKRMQELNRTIQYSKKVGLRVYSVDNKIYSDFSTQRKDCYSLKYPHLYFTEAGGVCADDFIFVKDHNEEFYYQCVHSGISDVMKINELKRHVSKLSTFKCVGCKDFREHYVKTRNRHILQEKICQIDTLHSNTSLDFIDDCQNMIKFLEMYGYISDGKLTLKGSVATEIKTMHEIFITEMLFGNFFKQLHIYDMISIVSVIINEKPDFQESSCSYREQLEGYNKMLGEYCIDLNFNCWDSVYRWCSGEEFISIIHGSDISEGEFVRLVLRLDEACKELKDVCEIIGDKETAEKLSIANTLIRRDIMFSGSLYTLD